MPQSLNRYEIWFKLNTEQHQWTLVRDDIGLPYHLAKDEEALFTLFESEELKWVDLADICGSSTQVEVRIPSREKLDTSAGPETEAFRDAKKRTYGLPPPPPKKLKISEKKRSPKVEVKHGPIKLV